MSNLKIIVIVLAAYFAFEGTWPFYNATHGDGSITTAFDYAFHIGGSLLLLFMVIRIIADTCTYINENWEN